MERTTKQAQLLHSLFSQSAEEITKEIAISISWHRGIPLSEVLETIPQMISSLFIYELIELLDDVPNGEAIAEKFVVCLGISGGYLNNINKLLGGDAESNFIVNLKNILDLDSEKEDTNFKFYYLRIESACKSIVDLVNKEADKIELKNGVFDYDNSTKQEKLESKLRKTKHHLVKDDHICPSCKYKGKFFKEFEYKGKGRDGYGYFECPNCRRHIKFDVLNRNIKSQKGLMGLLFGRFS